MSKVAGDVLDVMVPRDPQVLPAHLDLVDTMVPRGRMALQGHKDHKDTTALRAL